MDASHLVKLASSLTLLLAPHWILAEEQPTSLPQARLQELAAMEQYDRSDFAVTLARPLHEEFTAALSTMEPLDKFRLLECLFRTKEKNDYPSLEAVKETISGEFNQEQTKAICENMLAFLKTRQSHVVSGDGYERGAYYWLRALTRECLVRLASCQVAKPDPTASEIVKLPMEAFEGFDCLVEGWGVSLTKSGAGKVMEIATKKEFAIPSHGMCPLPPNCRLPDGHWMVKEDDPLILLEVKNGSWGFTNCTKPIREPWVNYAIHGNRLYWCWDPPPHYVGAVDRDPELRHDETYQKNLWVRFGFNDLTTTERKPQDYKNLPFFAEDTARSVTWLVGVLPSGRAVVQQALHLREDNDSSEIYVGDTPANESFSQAFRVLPNTHITIASGMKDRLILEFIEEGIDEFEEYAGVPERVVSYDVTQQKFSLIFKRSDETFRPAAWPLDPFGAPQWKLPPELAFPATDEVERCQMIMEGEDYLLLVEHWQPLQSPAPTYNLYRFSPGSAAVSTIQLELKRPTNIEVQSASVFQASLESCGAYWLLTNDLGTWRIEKKAITDAFNSVPPKSSK